MTELNLACQLVLTQRFGTEDMQMAFYYRGSNALTSFPSLSSVATAFISGVLPEINAVQTGDVANESLRLRMFNGDGSQLAVPLTGTGTRSAAVNDTLPPFVAVGYTLGGDNPAVRNGAKRVGGIAETDQIDGVWGAGAFSTILTALGNELTAALTAGTELIVPIIVKRIASGIIPPFNYRLPENLLESVYSDIIEATWNTYATSQVSRKRGRTS